MFTPLAIQKAHKGMQGSDYFKGVELEKAKQLWIESAELAIQQAEKMEKFGISKQIVNRVVEPYQYYQVLVTATEWDNFFELRCPQYHYDLEDIYFKSRKDWLAYYKLNCIGDPGSDFDLDKMDWYNINKSQAEIHIQKIAEMMWDEINLSIPKILKEGQWHIPYSDNMNISADDSDALWQAFKNNRFRGEYEYESIPTEILVATARAARISYTTLGDNPKIDYEADIKLHDRLLESKHLSCFEHCARVMSDEEYQNFRKGYTTTRLS